jgi:hypothetical protein
MRKIVSGILAVAAAIVLGVYGIRSAAGAEAKYVQSGCEISESYFAYIILTAESQAGNPKARKYSVEFNPERVIVRFPPAHYTLKWEQTTIVIAYRGGNSDAATLSLGSYGFSTTGGTRAIGEIRGDCWMKVKGYIGRNVHVPVHIIETVSGL